MQRQIQVNNTTIAAKNQNGIVDDNQFEILSEFLKEKSRAQLNRFLFELKKSSNVPYSKF
jgi:hypothetical protein